MCDARFAVGQLVLLSVLCAGIELCGFAIFTSANSDLHMPCCH